MVTVVTADRGELVDLQHQDTQAYLADAFDWLRDLAARGARAGAETLDDWSKEFAALDVSAGGLQDYLREQDNWVAKLFAEILSVVELVNPLSAGKQIAIWILEDFRDLLRALATLVDTEEDTAQETQDALVELALAGAALGIPYVGRAGKIITRVYRGFDKLEDGLAMLRHIGKGNVVEYLQKLNLPQYADKIVALIRKILAKVGEALGRWLPKVKTTLEQWAAKIGNWIGKILAKVQKWINDALAAIQKKLYDAASNLSNAKVLDKLPDQLLDWVAAQINGNLCESCVDNYFVNFMAYERLHPAPGSSKRDTSSFFAPDTGIDGLFEKPAQALSSPTFPANYSGIPLSLGHVLEELHIEIEDVEVPKVLERGIKPFGNIPADFNPSAKKPPLYPRFVVMEAKFGFHATSGTALKDVEWERRLGVTSTGQRQMGRLWIRSRLNDIYPPVNGAPAPKDQQIRIAGHARWLYGCQPHKAENHKRARPRGGKRMVGLAFFPPYALRGYDIDGMGWKV